jgi:hypothetical protein
MKYKKGKGRKIRKLVRCFKLKTGSGKFQFSGKGANWGAQSMVPLAVSRAKWITQAREQRKSRGDR